MFKDERIYAISPDPTEQSRKLAKDIASDGRGEIGYSLLSDPKSATIDRYGLRDPAYAHGKNDGVPKPAVIVLDREGRVRWMKVEDDYRERPSVEDISAALDRFE